MATDDMERKQAAADIGKTASRSVWLENPPVSGRQRRLFNRLLWHAVDHGGGAGERSLAMGPLAELLGIRGKAEDRLLLACRELAQTRIRWTFDVDGRREEGFCPLLAQCWCAQGRLHYAFSERLEAFIASGLLFKNLALHLDDLFRSEHGAALYRYLKTLADVETDGWRDQAFLCRVLNTEPEALCAKVLDGRVIEPALAEINALSELAVSVQYRRGTEGIEAVKFRVQPKGLPASSCLRLPGAANGDSGQAAMDAFEAHKAEQVCTLTQGMDGHEVEAVKRAFLAQIQANPVLMARYERDGFDSLAVKLAYEVFLEKMLLTDDQRDFRQFKEILGDP